MTKIPGQFTREEILSQPEALSDALKVLHSLQDTIAEFNPLRQFNQILFTGCGSTYYLSLAAASFTQSLTGCLSRGVPASEVWLNSDSVFSHAPGGQPTLLVAVSRSGETTETLRACETFLAEHRGALITLSCYDEMPLAQMGALNLVLPSGQERSIAQTRAFSTLFLGTLSLAALWSNRRDWFDLASGLPEAYQRVLQQAAPLSVEISRQDPPERFYWLGSGPRYGLAAELSLKMKEMSLSHSEPFHFMEFRHGPKSMVTPETLVIGLRSTNNSRAEKDVLRDIALLGSHTLELAESDVSSMPEDKRSALAFDSGLDEAIHSLLYLPVGQLIAFERALAKGLDPDKPHNLDSVVKLQGGG